MRIHKTSINNLAVIQEHVKDYMICILLPHFLWYRISCLDERRVVPFQRPRGGSPTRNSSLESSGCLVWMWYVSRNPFRPIVTKGFGLQTNGACNSPVLRGNGIREWCEDRHKFLIKLKILLFIPCVNSIKHLYFLNLPMTGNSYLSRPTTEYWHGISWMSHPFTAILLEEVLTPDFSSKPFLSCLIPIATLTILVTTAFPFPFTRMAIPVIGTSFVIPSFSYHSTLQRVFIFTFFSIVPSSEIFCSSSIWFFCNIIIVRCADIFMT